MREITETELSSALHSAPIGGLDVDAHEVLRIGRRRRRTKAVATLGGAALLLATVVTGVVAVTGGPGRDSSVTTGGQSGASLAPSEHHAALVTWADCLRESGIPGVTVIGPAADSDAISYLDEQGKPLPKDYRKSNDKWDFATELCAAKTPALLPELQAQWGDLLSPARPDAQEAAAEAEYAQCLADHHLPPPFGDNAAMDKAAKVGCVFSPNDVDPDQILTCPTGQQPSDEQVIDDGGPWVDSMRAAGQAWLERQSDRDEFARVAPDPRDHDGKAVSLLIKSRAGDTTANLILDVRYGHDNVANRWRLLSQKFCQ